MTETVKSFDWSERPLVVGEVAQAHDGSLGMAHSFIDAIADAGADAVKFQTHIASAESRPQEPWRVRFSYEDESRFDYWRRMEFTPDQWVGLREHATERGLAFVSSPFSIEAVELLVEVGISAWKIASGELSNTVLIDRVAAAGQPVLLSTGMSDWTEIDAAVAQVSKDPDRPFAVLQCTSAYPTPAEDVGLNVVQEIGRRYGCASGLSDHSGTVFPSLAAATLGARVIEVHVTLSPKMFGPDVPASLTPAELRELCEGVRYIEAAVAAPVDKAVMAERLADMREMFTRSIVARTSLDAGTVLTEEHLTVKKPAGGLPPARLQSLLGRQLRVPLEADASLLEEHLEPARDSG